MSALLCLTIDLFSIISAVSTAGNMSTKTVLLENCICNCSLNAFPPCGGVFRICRFVVTVPLFSTSLCVVFGNDDDDNKGQFNVFTPF